MTPRVRRTPSPAIGAGSKFLKKKPQPANNDAVNSAATAKKPVGAASGVGAYRVKPSGARAAVVDDDDDSDYADENFAGGAKAAAKPAGTVSGHGSAPKSGRAPVSAPSGAKKGSFQVSSALNKATALTKKITQRSSNSGPLRRTRGSLLDSDTDESISPVLRGVKHSGRGSRPGSASDNSVGHDGNKFIKKRGGSAEANAESDGKGAGRQSPARATSKEKARAMSPG